MASPVSDLAPICHHRSRRPRNSVVIFFLFFLLLSSAATSIQYGSIAQTRLRAREAEVHFGYKSIRLMQSKQANRYAS